MPQPERHQRQFEPALAATVIGHFFITCGVRQVNHANTPDKRGSDKFQAQKRAMLRTISAHKRAPGISL
ncbi:Hypothetical protein ABZS17G119_01206 [Kosakonia cowanii]